MLLKKNLRNKNTRGFSLLELLLAASLIPILSLVIFSNITSGMRLWQAVNRSVAEEDLNILRQKLSLDMAGAFKFSAIPFTGEPTRMSFASTVEAPEPLGGELGIGQVTIYYDDSKKVLVRQESNWSDLYKESPGSARVLMPGLGAFSIQYFYFDDREDDYVWSPEWDSSKKFLPIAVRFTFRQDASASPFQFTFPLRTGG